MWLLYIQLFYTWIITVYVDIIYIVFNMWYIYVCVIIIFTYSYFICVYIYSYFICIIMHMHVFICGIRMCGYYTYCYFICGLLYICGYYICGFHMCYTFQIVIYRGIYIFWGLFLRSFKWTHLNIGRGELHRKEVEIWAQGMVELRWLSEWDEFKGRKDVIKGIPQMLHMKQNTYESEGYLKGIWKPQ